MPLRLVLGLVKGLIVGGLIGYGLAAAGFAVLPAWLAYVVAPAAGLIIATVAGKPIWAKDAKIEVIAKAVAGAVFAPLLMLAARSYVTMGLPVDPSLLPAVSAEGANLATFSVTSLAMVTAVLGAFFDADHDPNAEEEEPSAEKTRVATDGGGRIAAEELAEEEAEPDPDRANRRKRA